MTSPAARRCARNARTSSPIPRPHLCARTPRTSPSRTRARSQRTSTRFSRRPSPARATSCCSRPSCARRTRAARAAQPRAPRVHRGPAPRAGGQAFPNEHFRATSVVVESAIGATGAGETPSSPVDGRALRRAPRERRRRRRARARRAPRGELVAAHVANERGIPVVVVTDDEALLALRAEAPAATPRASSVAAARVLRGVPPGSLALAERERVEARRRDAEEAERAWRSADECFRARAL